MLRLPCHCCLNECLERTGSQLNNAHFFNYKLLKINNNLKTAKQFGDYSPNVH
nr:MAG TPA: hypothetical protein [Caudoviricetes sp.]